LAYFYQGGFFMAFWPFANGMDGISKDAFQAAIDTYIFTTYIEKSPFSTLMGTSHEAPIIEDPLDGNSNIVKGKGYAVSFFRRQDEDYKNPILDQAQVSGMTTTAEIDSCIIACHKITFKAPEIRDASVLNYASYIGINQSEADRLAKRHQRYLDYQLLYRATMGLYKPTVAGNAPQPARAVAGNLIPDEETDGIYTYDAGTTLAAALNTSIPADRSSKHLMSYQHISRLRTLALGRFTEDPVPPASVTMLNGSEKPEFWLFMNTTAANNLRNDPDMKDSFYNRGALLPDQPNLVGGAHWMGKVLDVNLVEWSFMDDASLAFSTSGDVPICWSLLFGACAWGIYWKKPLMYWEGINEEDDIVNRLARQHMGCGPLLFNTKAGPASLVGGTSIAASAAGSLVEQAIVHSFTAAS